VSLSQTPNKNVFTERLTCPYDRLGSCVRQLTARSQPPTTFKSCGSGPTKALRNRSLTVSELEANTQTKLSSYLVTRKTYDTDAF